LNEKASVFMNNANAVARRLMWNIRV